MTVADLRTLLKKVFGRIGIHNKPIADILEKLGSDKSDDEYILAYIVRHCTYKEQDLVQRIFNKLKNK